MGAPLSKLTNAIRQQNYGVPRQAIQGLPAMQKEEASRKPCTGPLTSPLLTKQ